MGDSNFSVKICVFLKIIYNYYKAILEQKVNFFFRTQSGKQQYYTMDSQGK